MISKNRLKSLLDYKDVAIDISGGTVRFNYEIGNDNAWREIEVDGRTVEEIAALINTIVSKARTGKVSNVS